VVTTAEKKEEMRSKKCSMPSGMRGEEKRKVAGQKAGRRRQAEGAKSVRQGERRESRQKGAQC